VAASAPSGGGYLSYPVSGAYVSSEFGLRFHPILHIWRLHAGIDFAAACGTPVHAAAPGSVVSAGWAGGYGNRIVVNHGLVRGVSLSTTYNHLTRILVHGGHVGRGQLIGYSGTTGTSTGCHLHFETYDNGTPVNPRRWL
jgi:murein DD-endopeptidase MepM/ murein hydrolase activator NlpD